MACTLRVEWLWQSNESEWINHSDVETLILEDAYRKKMPHALLDECHVNVENFTQTSNNDEEKEDQPVKRIILDSKEPRRRRLRFLLEPILAPPPGSKSFTIPHSRSPFIAETLKHLQLSNGAINQHHRLIVEKAAEGLIAEGKLLSKECEAKRLAEELLLVKDCRVEEIARKCAYLYTLDSFLYRKLNETMRLIGEEEYEHMWKEKVATLGPFAYLLLQIMLINNPQSQIVHRLYRGCNLEPKDIERWKHLSAAHKNSRSLTFYAFPSFTSTTRSRDLAEIMAGNVLFIILNYGSYRNNGQDISPYSQFTEKEEFLIKPGLSFRVEQCEFDINENKWIILLGIL